MGQAKTSHVIPFSNWLDKLWFPQSVTQNMFLIYPSFISDHTFAKTHNNKIKEEKNEKDKEWLYEKEMSGSNKKNIVPCMRQKHC